MIVFGLGLFRELIERIDVVRNSKGNGRLERIVDFKGDLEII